MIAKVNSPSGIIVHVLLGFYGIILAYVIAGLVFNLNISAYVFFGLSFALLIFALAQSVFEIGAKGTLVFFIASGLIGFAAEAVGTNTGLFFGRYHYTDFLGTKEFGVPLVVPLVWFVIAYLTFSIAFQSYLSRRSKMLELIALAAFGSVAWDLLIDPMFTSYGYWVWDAGNLGSLSGIPITNFVGWFVVVFVMLSLISFFLLPYLSGKDGGGIRQVLFRRRNSWDSRIAYILLLIDGTVANLSLGNRLVAALGASAMVVFLVLTYFLAEHQRNLPSKIRDGIKPS